MKPSSRFRTLFSVAAVTTVAAISAFSSAAEIIWSGPTNGLWSSNANWTPNAVPGAEDIVRFNLSAGAIAIKLDNNFSTAGLLTTSGGSTNHHRLIGEGTNRILTIGASGISHGSGGITIGSATAGERVDVLLSDSQTWNSSRNAGSGESLPITVHNNVSLQEGLGAQTLTLTGNNTLSAINGILGNEANSVLSLIKTGTGVWTLNGASTYSGSTSVNQGTLRLGRAGVKPSSISVASGASLSFRIGDGTTGLTVAQVDNYINNSSFAAGAFAALDTSTGNATYTGNYSSNVALVKTGTNTLTFTGNNTPGAGFFVDAGTAQIANGASFSGAATVRNTGTLLIDTSASLSGNVVVNGGGVLILSRPLSPAATVTVSSTGAIIARAGGSGFTESEIAALRSNSSVTLDRTSYFGISTANGDFSYGTVLPDNDTNRFTKAEANTLFLTAQNSYAGGTQITGGILSVSDMKNGGQISQIGRADGNPNSIILAGGRLQYTGGATSTNRLFNLTSSSAIEASGTGAIVFTGNGNGNIATDGNAQSRELNLTGYNGDDNRMGVNILNPTANGFITSVIKNGYGKWILSGNNTYTGNTIVRGGTLVLDYSGGKTPIAASGSTVAINNGTLHFMGSGAQTIGTLNIAENDNGLSIIRVSGGMNLGVTTLTTGSTILHQTLIDLSDGGSTLNYTNLGTTLNNAAQGGLLQSTNNQTSYRANIIVRTSDGYGFASASAGSIQKLAGHTAVASTAVMNSATTNYLISAGTYTTSGNQNFQTATFDSSSGRIDFTFNSGHNMVNNGTNGRAVLLSGSNDISFKGAGGGPGGSVWFHNYLDEGATFNLETSLGSNSFVMVGGTGFTNYTGSGLGAGPNGEFILNGGLFRYAPAAPVTLNSVNHRINQGVFEVGGNLSGGGALDLERTTGNFQLRGDAGFSAYVTPPSSPDETVNYVRTVSLGTDLTWGASNFLVNTSGADGDHAFRLSSTRSNATLDFKSNINLNGKMRTVDVANGSASVDARLSGNLTGSGIGSRLAKTGLGTLELTGTNTYSGMTRVEEGKLRIGGGGLTATTSIHVQNSTLELAAGDVINDAADITLENATFNTASAPETLGRLTLIGDNKLDLVGLGNIIKMADSSSLVWSSSLSIYNWNGNAGGGGADQFFIGTTNAGVTTDQLSKIFFVDPTVDGISYAGTFNSSILGNGEIVAVIPEPSAAALALLASVSLMLRRRRYN